MREGAFPDPDEPIDAGGRRKAEGLVIRPAPDLVLTAPTLAARQTAEALGYAARPEPALADSEFGVWQGRSLVDLQESEPEALIRWIQDPTPGAPGGEPFAEVVQRVSAWMQSQAPLDMRILAVTHQNVMRAALAHGLDMPPNAAFRIDIAPLTMLTVSFNGQWRLQGLSDARTVEGIFS